LRNDDQIAECIRASDIVYNLVGRDYETKYVLTVLRSLKYILDKPWIRNYSFEEVHVKGAGRIARIASELNVPRFVHVSHLNASRESRSAFYRSKAAAEENVRQAFVDASIVRPAIMFGHEDKLLNNMACL